VGKGLGRLGGFLFATFHLASTHLTQKYKGFVIF
jgi:hypothetical protein